MIYIIFSDVHSNLEALQTFLEIADGIVHDKKVCLGDLVGYGADPNPCIELVRDRADLVLGGNHDYAVTGRMDLSRFNAYAYQACLWTRDRLTRENREFLESLPARREEEGVCWAHSSPFEPEQWHYIFSVADGARQFDHFKAPLCFVGHTHVPMILEKTPDGEIAAHPIADLKLVPRSRYIVNVGSLGQPRDGNPDPAFVIFDDDSMIVEYRRFTYDYATTQNKIVGNGLPGYLADRLSVGR
ncbi:MAG: metallophosphoesterase family protein [Nitrospinales bacterium]